MDENVFRIVVTVAVVMASLAFVVQAGIMFALYKATRKTQGNAEMFLGKLDPLVAKAGPAIDEAKATIARLGPLIERAGPVIDRVGPVLDETVPVVRKASAVMDEARAVTVKAGRFVDRATDIATNASLMVNDARPQVKQISEEALEITRLGREQAEKIGELVQDANDKVRARLNQVDEGVDQTIEQVEHVGAAVKRAAMVPVREVNGLAAGISAAVSALMRNRKSSVDSATQDEEMFI